MPAAATAASAAAPADADSDSDPECTQLQVESTPPFHSPLPAPHPSSARRVRPVPFALPMRRTAATRTATAHTCAHAASAPHTRHQRIAFPCAARLRCAVSIACVVGVIVAARDGSSAAATSAETIGQQQQRGYNERQRSIQLATGRSIGIRSRLAARSAMGVALCEKKHTVGYRDDGWEAKLKPMSDRRR